MNISIENPGYRQIEFAHQVKYPLMFEELGLYRRACMGLLRNVKDPESNRKMQISPYKSSRQTSVDTSRNVITNPGGYKLARATRSLPNQGRYYWEVIFIPTENEKSHCRVGITTNRALLEGPAGCDEFGYSVADLGGGYHMGKRVNKEIPGFKEGDVVGIGIDMDGALGKMRLWINGNNKGMVFSDIDVTMNWFPSFSCYEDAVLQVKFDVPFTYNPGNNWLPAACIPKREPTEKLTVNEVAQFMKTGQIDLISVEMDQAVEDAMTPYSKMAV